MKALLGLAAVVLLALGVVAGAVLALDDTETLTSPPEAVAEGFMKGIAAERYGSALSHLDESLHASVNRTDLRAATRRYVASKGTILDVRGVRVVTSKQRATAGVDVETANHGPERLSFRLRFADGVWRIDELPVELLEEPR